jgi:membrane-bound lytic murein transglycosylase A
MKLQVKAISLVFLGFVLTACAGQKKGEEELPYRLVPTPYLQIDGWKKDQQGEALEAFRKSCVVLNKKNPNASFRMKETGRANAWQDACSRLPQGPVDNVSARLYFEEYFMPFRVETQGGKDGLFTGYYEAEIRGSLTRKGHYQTPLWSRPEDLVVVQLGMFDPEWKGRKITGKAKGGQLTPYDARKDITIEAMKGRAKPLVWVDDPVGAFFMEIQGSGKVTLPNGKNIRLGYAAQNGHGYVPIGRVLLARGEIEKPVTMQKIRAWLEAHPERAQSMMNENPSVVFFKKIDGEGPIGAQGVALSPLRSLAIDPAFLPLGAPLWLETEKHSSLVIAQDTGGAIKGAIRGDLFWGSGPAAEKGAGEMQERGSYVILLPKGAVQR